MRVTLSQAASFLLVSATLVSFSPAAEQYEPSSQFGPGASLPGGRPPSYNIMPGYWMLGMESVQKELGLSGDQRRQLKKIAADYHSATRRAAEKSRSDWEAAAKLSREERQKVWSQQREKMVQETGRQTAEARKRIEKVLLPDQLEKLKELSYRARVGMMLLSPKVLQKIGVTEEQKAKFRGIWDETQVKIQKVQREAVDQSLEILTPEQRAKLKELSSPERKS